MQNEHVWETYSQKRKLKTEQILQIKSKQEGLRFKILEFMKDEIKYRKM